MSETKDLNFEDKVFTLDTDNSLQSLSLTKNKNNELRVAYSTHTDSTENSGIYYTSISSTVNTNCLLQNNMYVCREKIDGTKGLEKNIVLKLDKQNRPTIIYSTPSNDIVYLQRTKNPSGYSWATSNIAFNETITDLNSMDFTFDHYNSPRIIFDSSDKIRYARRLPEKNNEWIVETPEEGKGEYGEYSALYLDSENRAHIVYTSDDDKWFKYWAEPMFFDYREYNVDSIIANIDEVN